MTAPLGHFVALLVRVVPSLKPLHDEHLQEYGELLAHVFMGDVTRWCIESHRRSMRDDASSRDLRVLLVTLEDCFAFANADVQELISASFLENLHQARDQYESLKALLGPLLQDELQRVE